SGCQSVNFAWLNKVATHRRIRWKETNYKSSQQVRRLLLIWLVCETDVCSSNALFAHFILLCTLHTPLTTQKVGHLLSLSLAAASALSSSSSSAFSCSRSCRLYILLNTWNSSALILITCLANSTSLVSIRSVSEGLLADRAGRFGCGLTKAPV